MRGAPVPGVPQHGGHGEQPMEGAALPSSWPLPRLLRFQAFVPDTKGHGLM